MAKKIFLIGAGRSATTLIKYLLNELTQHDWALTIGEQNVALAEGKINGASKAKAIAFNALNAEERELHLKDQDLVISMLPAHLHADVVDFCISNKINIITPSYVSPEIKAMDERAKDNGVLVLNELGVDPGIDHMSAMQVLDRIRATGAKLQGFESFTGGLLAPESENNPWKYKFTWNPRNVVLAGQGGAAKFIQEGQYKYIPYQKLFRRTEFVEIDGYGRFEGYANRDSLKYRETYGLEDIPTIYRGTFRRPGFCRAWDVFIQLGATDDSYQVQGVENMTHRDFINMFLAYNPHDSVELKLMHYMKLDQDDDMFEKLVWLGIFDKEPIGLKEGTPAQILQRILEKKMSLDPEDKDMIVMWHKFNYDLDGKSHELHSSMVCIGDDHEETAMSKTVGLPIGIAAKLLLTGKLNSTGVQVPTQKHIYEPILEELAKNGVVFREKVVC
ncbi:MAG: saccharopine dehydrogenase-like NADP-dependent oxidoreductase [Sphingobacteriales bacterium]|jgi:saccharopine dehydrogenase-like NADP-dependent oxidoreductase